MSIVFVIGASGSGKTSALKALQSKSRDEFYFCFFDHFGVPSDVEVKEKFGGWEAWQIEITNKWLDRAAESSMSMPTLFEGQTPPAMIEEVCAKRGVNNYKVILVDCADQERRVRLERRGHPELADERMMNWAKFLRDESKKRGYKILDNTGLSERQGFMALEGMIREELSKTA